MKTKTLALLLAVLLLLTACGSPPAETTAPAQTTVSTTAPVETTAPPATTEPPVELTRYPLNADSTYVKLAQELPAHIYTTTGSENGLAGTVYLFEGTVKEHSSTANDGFVFEQIVVATPGGDVMIMNFYKALYNATVRELGESTAKANMPYPVEDFCLPNDAESSEFLGIYIGYSNVAQIPVFYLGANPVLFEMLEYPDPAAAAQKPAETTPATQPTEAVTTGQRNALKHALSYLDFTNFSYSGLIGQLEYEGYTTEEATYAADNCGADWKAQALSHAKSYLSFSAFSYSGLIDQLEYEGYTAEEAAYAADNCGADWMEQAVKCAESYLNYSAFSRSGLIEQLEYEGFTYEQAVYGAEQNGY